MRGKNLLSTFAIQDRRYCGPCGRFMILGDAGLCIDCELIFRLAKLERTQFVRELQRFRK